MSNPIYNSQVMKQKKVTFSPLARYAQRQIEVERWPVLVRLAMDHCRPGNQGYAMIGPAWRVVCPGPASLRYLQAKLAALVAEMDGVVVVEEDPADTQ